MAFAKDRRAGLLSPGHVAIILTILLHLATVVYGYGKLNQRMDDLQDLVRRLDAKVFPVGRAWGQ